MRLEFRDQQVLAEAFLSKVVRRDDLIRLGLFGSVPRCNARLLALSRFGLLGRRSDITGCNLCSPLYFCTAKGVRVAADFIEVSQVEAIESHRRGMTDLSIRHALKSVDLHVQFARERADGKFRFGRWSHEFLCRHDFKLSNGSTFCIKPDGMVELTNGQRKVVAFIEADLGNVSVKKFADKVSRYHTYQDSRAFTDAYRSDSFAVLTVTTNEVRLLNLVRTAHRPNFLFSTWQRISRGLFAGRTWIDGQGKESSLTSGIERVLN